MKRKWSALRAMLVMAGFLLPCAAFADQPFSQLIIISGSLSDVGNYASVHGWFPAPFFEFRSTNGPNLDDYFAEALNFPDKPSGHLTGPVQGNNFSVFQSLAGGHGPEDLPAQVQAYLDSRGGMADPKALHLLLIAGTDVINAMQEPDDVKAHHMIDAAVIGNENAIRTLVQAGAKTIFAPNFSDLGSTPGAINSHLVARATRVSVEYNTKYAAMLDRVERELDFDLIRWDFFTYTHQFLAKAHELGFTNTTQACVDLSASGDCGDLSKFVFLADFFPTTRVHRFFAMAMVQAFLEHQKERCRREGHRDCDRY